MSNEQAIANFVAPMASSANQSSGVKIALITVGLFMASMLTATLITYVPSVLGLFDDYRLGRLMAPWVFRASPFMLIGCFLIVRRHYSAGGLLLGLPLIGLTLLSCWVMAIAIRIALFG